MRVMRSYFSVGDRVLLIEMSFGYAWSPTLTWITLSSIGGSHCSKRFSHCRSSCWAYGSVMNGSISSSYSSWLIGVMLANSFLKTTPTLISESSWTSLMIAMVGTRQTLILTEKVNWRILTLCVCGRNSWLFFLSVRKVAKVCAALY